MATTIPTKVPEQIILYLGIFRPFFSKAEFENLVILVLGILSDTRNKTIVGIASVMDNLKDHTVLSKFLTSASLSTYHLKMLMRKLFLSMIDTAKPIFLYVDDTLIEKAGKKVKARLNHSVSKGKAVFSNCFVIGLVKNGNLELPFEFEKYLPENEKGFKSKIELAFLIIKKFISWFGKKTYVLFDTWYSCTEIIHYLNKEGVKFITRLKSNRVVIINSVKINLKEYAKGLDPRKFRRIEFGDKEYFIYSEILHINKIGDVKVIFSKKRRYGRKTVFIITNDYDLDEKIAIENYVHRWEVEQFFKDMKGDFGFEEYQETKQVGVSRHIALQFVAYFLVSVVGHFLGSISKAALTIGEILKKIRSCLSDVKMNLLRRLYLRKFEVNLM